MRRLATIILCVATMVLFGCGGEGANKKDEKKKDDHAGHDHGEHGHSHAHEEGPHGGHLLELTDDHSIHAEWLHDDATGKITVFFIDKENKDLPIVADSIKIDSQIEGKESVSVDVPAVRTGDAKTTAQFEIVDKALNARLKIVGDGVTASLTADINGKVHTAKFEKHDHDH